MEESDQITEGVQPDDGQGAGEQQQAQDAPYSEYLNRIPEEARGPAEEAFKAFDANTTRKFQEHADYRKGWEPYEQLGVNQLSPDEVQWLVQFRQALDDPQSIQQWYESYAQQYGLTPQQAQQQAEEFDPNLGMEENPVLSQMQQQLAALDQWREQQEHQVRMQEAERFVSSQLDELKEKHPQEFNQEAIEKLVAQYIETDPQNAVQLAFRDWQNIRSQLEKATLQSKVNAPAGAEAGGMADGSPPQIKTLKEAEEFARAQLREANRQ